MPELPEVETTLRGIKSFVNKQRITKIIVRHPRLRWPISEEIKSGLSGQLIHDIKRRAKYLLPSAGDAESLAPLIEYVFPFQLLAGIPRLERACFAWCGLPCLYDAAGPLFFVAVLRASTPATHPSIGSVGLHLRLVGIVWLFADGWGDAPGHH